jgi:hypothetical protein
MRSPKRALGAGLLAALAAGALACGGEDGPRPPSGQAMAPQQAADERQGNGAPRIDRVDLNPRDPVAGVPISAVVDASDPDGDPLRIRYEWTHNGRAVADGARPGVVLNDLHKGDRVEVTVVASDGQLSSEPRHAWGEVANRAPLVDAVALEPEGTVRAGDVIVASPLARDPDEDSLRFEYAWLVNGNERRGGRELPTEGLKRGDRVQVRVVASDGASRSEPVLGPEVILGNTPPRITRLPDLETESGTFRYQFEAVDPDGDRNLRFFLDQAPPGMTIDPILGVVSWKPDASQAGKHPVEVGVKDGQGEGTTFLFEVTVTATLPEPAAGAPEAPPAAPAPDDAEASADDEGPADAS